MLALCAFPALRAQTTRVEGQVQLLGDSARAVAGAEVSLLPGLRTTRSDSSGAFHFDNVAPGHYTLRARQVGLEVANLDLVLSAQGAQQVRLSMRAGAQALSAVTIAGQRMLFPARYSDAYQRVAKGKGVFFTREQIDSLNPLDMKSLLQRAPTVHVNERGLTFERCQSGLVSNLSSGFSRSAKSSTLGAAPNPAHVQVYLDGVRLTRYDSGREDDIVDANEAIRDIPTTSIQLVEIYSGVARIPGEYLSDACAVILIWTK